MKKKKVDPLGVIIKRLRQEKKLSRFDIAQQIGVSCSQVANYEHGISGMPPERMRRLCLTLGVSPNELLGWTE